MPVALGDKVLIFPNKEGGHIAVGQGMPVSLGDRVVVNEGADGRNIHGESIISIGDRVIVVPERD